jgi:serine/threonine protein kinase
MKVSLLEQHEGSPLSLESARREAVERVLEEALMTAQLEHPGIVPVFDLGVDREGRGFFTMRLVKGHAFREVIDLARRGAAGWSLPRCVEALARICETVAFAHAKGVVHRDLKPTNIMVGFLGETYVMDWGLARILGKQDRHAMRLRFASPTTLETVETRRTGKPSEDPEDALATPAGTVVGTPVYMPPEQAQGEVEKVNQTSDVYALGAILYTLLAGRPPYVPADGKASPLSIIGKVIEGPPLPVREIDPAAPKPLVAICEKAMARSQADRHPDALSLARELQDYALRRGERFPGARLAVGAGTGRARSWPWIAAIALAGLAALVLVLRSQRTGGVDELEVRATLQELGALDSDLERLAPPMSRQVDALNGWLERARSLSGRATAYKAALEEVEARPDDAPASLLGLLRQLIERLDALNRSAASEGTIAAVERRLAFRRLVRRRTIEETWSSWQEAVAAIAARERCPAYDGFRLEPQEGFIPLGHDPVSGLWEFGHLETGSIPRRGPGGGLEMTAENGLVFVLVPGVAPREPILVSKRLMTRAQWRRATGGETDPEDDRRLEPVTDVSWAEVERVLRRLGLGLPAIEPWWLAAGGGLEETDKLGVRPVKPVASTQEDSP